MPYKLDKITSVKLIDPMSEKEFELSGITSVSLTPENSDGFWWKLKILFQKIKCYISKIFRRD